MQPNEYKEVNYFKYCKTCKFFFDSLKTDDTCFECLTTNVNYHSEKPILYEEDSTKTKENQNG